MSKKMLGNEKRKTVSERRRALLVVIGCSLALIGALGLSSSKDLTTIGGNDYILEIVDNDAELAQGLSGRQNLIQNSGMLFVFDNQSRRCMWMKDMNFALDMLWLDNLGKIVSIEENVTPESYPNNFCHDNAKYVIELNSGDVKRYNISIGQTVKL